MTTSTSLAAAAEALRDNAGVSVKGDGLVRAEHTEHGESGQLAAGADDMARSAPRRLATWTAILPALPVAPRTRTLWPGRNANPPSKGDPCGHGRIHGCGDEHRIAVLGEGDATAQVDHRLLGHRTHRGVGQDEVTKGAVRRRGPTPSMPGTRGSSPALV